MPPENLFLKSVPEKMLCPEVCHPINKAAPLSPEKCCIQGLPLNKKMATSVSPENAEL